MSDSVVFTASGLDALEKALVASPRAVERAENRALKRTITWVRKQMLREGSERFEVPQSRLKKARRSSVFVGRGGARAFLGTAPLKAGYAGNPRQQKKGAKVGRHKFPGAFVARMPSGYTSIFERRGKARLPLEEKVIKANISPSFLAFVSQQADQRLAEEFISNLEFYSGRRG